MAGFELSQRLTTRLGLPSLPAACTCACAGAIVQPSDLPPAPGPTARGAGTVGVGNRSCLFRTTAKYPSDKYTSDRAHWPRYGETVLHEAIFPETG